MKALEAQHRISELMSLLVTEVRAEIAATRTDFSRTLENVCIPLFSIVYGYSNLRNLNALADGNFPAIDLGDESARIAIQVTASSDAEKIKDTLRGFVKFRLYERFDRLIIYILTEKMQSYPGTAFEKIVDGNFTFDKDRDIQDYRSIVEDVSYLSTERVLQVRELLETNVGNIRATTVTSPPIVSGTETVYLNLLEVFFPPELYIADLNIDRKQVIKNSKSMGRPLHHDASTKDIVRAAMEQQGLRFAVDWQCFEGKIITFHDLEDEGIPLRSVIDEGTITVFQSCDFYTIDENYERVFKFLLSLALRQQLYDQRVQWQHEDKLLIFMPLNENEDRRSEQWQGRSEASRTVFERTRNTHEPEKTWYCKHFGFRDKYKCFGDHWYLLIEPDWFFSCDGYKRSTFSAEKVSWLKRRENNQHQFNHVRFVAHFLRQTRLFESSNDRRRFLSFGELVSFDNAPDLPDREWLPPVAESDSEASEETGQLTLPFVDQ